MCGIVYQHNFDGTAVNLDVINQFDKQRKRGVDGFGIFDGKGLHMVHAAQEQRIMRWLQKPKNATNLLLFHHRYPTTTVNVKRAAHPFSTKGKFGKTQYVLVHNGGVHNAEELKKEHAKRKIEYHSILPDGTFNDSEAFLWDFALMMEGKQKDLKAYGPCAFICMKLVNGTLTNMYFGRNWERPLRYRHNEKGLELSSEGDGEFVVSDTLYTYNYKQNRLYKKEMEVPEPIRVQPTYSSKTSHYDDDEEWAQRWYGNKATVPQSKADAGDWLGDKLRSKFARIYPPFRDTEHTQQKLYLPTGELKSAPPKTEEQKIKSVTPPIQEVQEEAMLYLTRAYGHFEYAYWMVEKDYQDNFDSKKNGRFKKQILLEEVMQYLQNDPDYRNENSTSSMFPVVGGGDEL